MTLGHAAVDLGSHGTYFVVAPFRLILSLGAIAGIIFNGEKIVGTKDFLVSSSCTLSLYHCNLTFIAVLLTFSPMHFLGFNVMPLCQEESFQDSFHSWNYLSCIAPEIAFLSFLFSL